MKEYKKSNFFISRSAVAKVLLFLYDAFIVNASYFLALWFSAYSQSISAAAAIFGVTAGEFFATLVLFLMF